MSTPQGKPGKQTDRPSTTEINGMKRDQLIPLLKAAFCSIDTLKSQISDPKEQDPQGPDKMTTSIESLLNKFQEQNNKSQEQNNLHLQGQFKKLNDRLDTISENVKLEIRQEFEPKIDQISNDNQILRDAICKQQKWMEEIDNTQRASNLILYNVPETSDMVHNNETATTDEEKCQMILHALDYTDEIDHCARLGKNEGKATDKRPLKVILSDPHERGTILKNATDPGLPKNTTFLNIRVKKDTHPAIRAEWARLHRSLDNEKKKAENAGYNLEIDFKKRVLTRNGVTIDEFKNPFI